MSSFRVVLDTHVLVSGLAYPNSIPGKIVGAWRQGAIDVVLSHYILEELVRVLPRLSMVSLNQAEIQDLADSLRFLADIVEPAGPAEASLRDIDDLPVLQTLIASGAQYLITGDKDLLALGHRYAVIEPAEFWRRHGF